MRTTELTARMRLDSAQFDRSLQQSQANLNAFARTTQALPGGSSTLFGALARDAANVAPILSSLPLAITAIGASLATVGVAARGAGVEFESALAKIATLGDDAQRNMAATRTAILDTLSGVGVTGGVRELAEANYLLQSSGRSATQAVEDLNVAAKAGVAGYTDAATAVDGLTTVTNAWAESQLSTKRASDVLFSAVNVGKATFAEIAQGIGVVAPLAASAGVRFEEVAAATALLSNQGVRTSSIFEGLRSAISNVLRPSEQFKKEYADLAAEFDAARLKQDGIIKFLQDFETRTGGARRPLQLLFSDVTGLTTVLGLMKNNGADAAAALRQMENAAGATDKALAQVATTTEYQQQLIRNQLTRAWTEFGALLNTVTLPVLESIARVLNKISGNASLATGDVAELLKDEQGGRFTAALFRQDRLKKVVDQYGNNPQQFLGALTGEQLPQLRDRLLRETEFADRIPVSMIAGIRAEIEARAARAKQEARQQQGAQAGASAEAARLRQEAEDERARVAREADAKKAADAAEKAARELQSKREQAVKDADQLTQQLQAKAAEALEGTAGALRAQLAKTLEEGKKLLQSGALTPAASAELQKQLAQFAQLQAELVEANDAAKETSAQITAASGQELDQALLTIAARERELQTILDGTKGLAARKLLEGQLTELAAERGKLTENVFALPEGKQATKDLRAQVQAYGDLAQSIANVGEAFGGISTQASAALRGIGALVEQGSKLQSLFGAGNTASTLQQVAGVAGLIGGVASLASALFSESPADAQRRSELRTNTEALRELTRNVGDLANASVSGAGLARVLGATTTAASLVPGNVYIKDAVGFAARFGASATEIKAVADSLGITLNGTAESYRQLAEAIRTADLASYTDSFAGSLQRLQDTITLDGVTDPIELLQRKIATLTDAKTGFPALAAALAGIDVGTEAGRTDAATRARALFDALASGSLSGAQLGGLSIGDARTALIDLIQQLRDGSTSSGTGGFNETRSITEVTGSRLAGLIGTSNTYLAAIAADMALLREAVVLPTLSVLRAPSLPAGLGAAGGVVIGSLTVSISVQLTRELLGVDASGVATLGDTLGRSVGRSFVQTVDQQLRENTRRQRLLTGNAVLDS